MRSLLMAGMRAKRAQPRTAVTMAVQRYSEEIMAVSCSPLATKTLLPPGMMRQTTGTKTTQAEKPTCLKVLEMETTLVRSVGLGVRTEAMPWEGTSPRVMAKLQMR